jgi:hypothetical protein
MFHATFSNISAISWRPVLVVEEAGVPGENHRPWASKQLVNFITNQINHYNRRGLKEVSKQKCIFHITTSRQNSVWTKI